MKPDVSKIPFRGWRVPALRCRFAVVHLHSAVLTPCREDLLILVRFGIFTLLNIKTTTV